MGKKLLMGLITILCFGIMTTNVFASPASYSIDSIYDNVNPGNWINTVPTLIGGQSYNVTINGHGNMGFLDPVDNNVTMGIFIDWNNTINSSSAWNGSSLSPALIGLFDYPGNEWTDLTTPKNYTISGILNVPMSVPTDRVAFMAFLDPDEGMFTTANQAYDDASTQKFYFTPTQKGVDLVAATNGGSSIPEPGSLSLLASGLFGMLGFFRKKLS